MPKECEIKLLIVGKSGMEIKEKFLEAFGEPLKTEFQQNYYFVSDGRSMVRLRITDGRALLTIKRGLSKRRGFFVSNEAETEIEMHHAMRVISSGCLHEGDYSGIKVDGDRKLLGMIKNARCFYRDFVFDITEFPDGSSEAEIEVEVTDAGELFAAMKKVAAMLAEKGFEFTEQKETKFERFLLRHGKVNRNFHTGTEK